MKVYLDILFLLNFGFDFLLLLSVSSILRRQIKIRRLLLGGFVGGLSIFILFLKINSLELFLLKALISLIMTLVTFGYRDIRYTMKNLLFLYMTSIILGGILYFLNVQFSYKQEGLVFYHNGLSINVIVLIFASPIFLYCYIKQGILLKTQYSNYYDVKITIDKKDYHLKGYMDTGNHLKDPYTGKPILLIYHKKIKELKKNTLLIPFMTASGSGIIPCIKVDQIEIKGIGVKKQVLCGLMDQKIGIDGVDCILNTKIMEGIYV